MINVNPSAAASAYHNNPDSVIVSTATPPDSVIVSTATPPNTRTIELSPTLNLPPVDPEQSWRFTDDSGGVYTVAERTTAPTPQSTSLSRTLERRARRAAENERVRAGERKILQATLEYIDENTKPKLDGKITLDNITAARELVKNEGGQSFGITNADGENLTTATMNRVLNFLDMAAKDFPADDNALNSAELDNAIKQYPLERTLFSEPISL